MVNHLFVEALLSSCLAGMITGVGGFMIFIKKKYSQEYINTMLSIAAGVMLAAAFFASEAVVIGFPSSPNSRTRQSFPFTV